MGIRKWAAFAAHFLMFLLFDDGSDGERNLYAFLPESGGQGFDEFVLQAELVIKAGGVQEDVEVNAAVAEVVKTYRRLPISIQFFIEVCENLTGYFQCYVFHFLQIAVIGHAHGNFDDDIMAGHTVVGDDGGGDFLIRDNDHISFTYGNNGGEAPSDIRYAAFFAGA